MVKGRSMRGTRRNPWRWLTEARVTYALKSLMLLVLAFYAGQFVLEILVGIRAVVYILDRVASFSPISFIRRFSVYGDACRWCWRSFSSTRRSCSALVIVALFIVPHIVDDVRTARDSTIRISSRGSIPSSTIRTIR